MNFNAIGTTLKREKENEKKKMKTAFIEPDGFVIDADDNPIPGVQEELERLESEGYNIIFLSHLWALTTWDYMVKALTKAGFWNPDIDGNIYNSGARQMVLRPSETADMEIPQWKSSFIIKKCEKEKIKEILVIDTPAVITPLIRKWQQFMGQEGLQYGYSLVEDNI